MSFFEIPLRVTFKRQIILTFVVGFFFLIAGFATYLVTTERDNLHRDGVNEATSMAQSLAASALPWVLANDVAGLQETVNAFHAYPEFGYAMIISPTGKVLAHSDPTKVGLYVTDEQSLALIKAPHDSRVMIDNESTIDVAVPIEIDKRQVGWARVGSGKQENTDNLRKMIWKNTVFLLLATACSFIAAMLIANRLGRRIGALVQVAEDVQAGNFSTRVSISSGGDEITTLGNSLNKMLDTLSQNEIDLRKASLYTRSLIEASVDPLVTISAEGKITDVNEATEKGTGINRAELIGTNFSDYFTEPEKAQKGYQQVFARGFVTDYPLALRHHDGHITDVLYNASVYRDEAGKVLGVFAAARDVTERNKAEAALRESEALQQTTMKILPVGLWVFGADGNIIFSNDAAKQLWAGVRYVGIEQLGEYKGWRVDSEKLVGPHEWAGARALEKGETTLGEEIEIECFDGTHKIILDSAVPLRNSDGSIRGAVTINQDITERKQAENALREKEERLSLATVINGVGIWDWNLRTREMIWDDSMYALYHMRREDFIGTEEAWRKSLHPDDLTRGDKEVADAIAGIKPFDTEFRVVWPNSEIHHIKAVAKVFRDDQGTPVRMLGTNMDISERKRMEQAIKDNEVKYRTLFETANDGIFLQDADAFVDCNQRGADLYGLAKADVVGHSPAEFCPERQPDGRLSSEVASEKMRAALDGEPQHFEWRPLRPDNTTFDVDVSLSRIELGGSVYLQAIVRDITERKKAEEALYEAQQVFRALIENSPDVIARYDRNCQRTYVNPTYLKAAQIPQQELLATAPAQISPLPAASAATLQNLLHKVIDSGIAEAVDVIWPKADNINYWYNIYAFPEYDREGRVVSVMTVSRDITERKLAEEEIKTLNQELEQRVIARTAQLEAANKELEAFSYSVSHDLRTPLRAIDGFSHILLEDYADKLDEEGKRLLNVVRENTYKMGQLIEDILKFSRAGRLEMTISEIDMERMAREVYEELRPSAPEHELQMEIGQLPHSRGDRAMMRQVFVNLLSNAIKFTRTREPARIKVGATVHGSEVIYFVQDNGAGFDMRYVDRLFGVFQRLHSESEFEGSGIGLAIVKRIITRHGGRVWAEGKVNEGATIYFALPT